MEGLGQSHGRGAQGGSHAKGDARQHRDAAGKEQRRKIHARLFNPWNPAGSVCNEPANAAVRKHDSQYGTDSGEHEVFCQKLQDDPQRSRAQSDSNCHFLLPGACSRQLQIGDVGASDQEDKGYSSQNCKQRYALVSQKNVGQRHEAEAAIFVVNRVILRFSRRQNGQLRLSALPRYTFLQSSKDIEKVIVIIGTLLRSESEWQPDIRFTQQRVEARRHDPEHHEQKAVYANWLPDQR